MDVKYKLSLLLILVSCTLMSYAQKIDSTYWDGQVYVKVKDEAKVFLPEFKAGDKVVNYPLLGQYISSYGITKVERPFDKLASLTFQNTYLVKFNKAAQIEELITALQEDNVVEYVEKVPLEKTFFNPNDELENAGHLWHLSTIKAYEAWAETSGSPNVVVAIVDDAVDIYHEDLKNSLYNNPNEIPNNGIDDDGNGYIDDMHGWDMPLADNDNNPSPPANANTSHFSHGTHVAGLIGATTNNGLGVSSIGCGISIMGVKCTADSTVDARAIQYGWAGVQYAISAGADIINLSWGGLHSSATYEAIINYAESQGVLIVAAAGNSNVSTKLYPAAYDKVVAVGATDKSDKKANFSNYGTWVNIMAPGSALYSCVPGSSKYYKKSGTSMAAPVVAGTVALMLSHNPTLTPAQLRTCLYSSTDNINSKNANYIGSLGAGRLNAYKAVVCASPGGCLTPYDLTTSDQVNNSIKLKWSGSADNYSIKMREVGTSSWQTFTTSNTYYNCGGIESCKTYEFQVRATCGTEASNFSTTQTFETLPDGPQGYCEAKGSYTNFEWLNTVKLAGETFTTGNDGGYGDYICSSVTVDKGETFTISASPKWSANPYNEYIRMWVDWNQDGDFNDAGELAYDAGTYTTSSVSGSITVPSSAKSGATRLRVAMKWVGPSDPNPPTPCLTFQFGEVEDYTIVVGSSNAQTTCNIPSSLNVGNISDNSAAVSWSAVTGANSYTIQYKASNESAWKTITSSTNSKNITGLNAVTNYQFKVKTNCSGSSTSNYSSAKSFLTKDKACNTPTSLSANNVTANSAVVSWSQTYNGANFIIRYRKWGTSSWQYKTSNTTVVSLTSLQASATYEVQVKAECSSNNGSAYTTSKTFATTALLCSPPSVLNVANVTTETAVLTWGTVAGGSSYSIRYRKVGTSSWSSITSTSTSKTVNNLVSGTNYEFQVKTNCSSNNSSYSNSKLFATLTPSCNAPTNITSSNVTDKTATISWSSSSSVTSKTVRYRKVGTSSWIMKTVTGNAINLTGLTATATYQYQVRANCSAASSSYSTTKTVTTKSTPCSAPVTLNATSPTSTTATLTWNNVSGASSYTIQYRRAYTNGYVPGWTSISTTTTNKTITGLIADTNYEFQVKTNCSGSNISNYSTKKTFSTATIACSIPTGIGSSGITSTGGVVSWAAVATASNYKVRYRKVGASSWTNKTSSTTYLQLTALTAGATYEYQIQTDCGTNDSNFSSSKLFVTPAQGCGTPNNLTTSNVGENTATLKWNAVAGVSNYILRYKNVSTSSWATMTIAANTTTKAINGLLPNTNYHFQVKTICEGSSSAYSSTKTFATQQVETCVAPASLNAVNISGTSATITWGELGDISDYTVKYKREGYGWIIQTSGSNSKTISNLVPNVNYEVKVRAKCSDNTISSYSPTINFTTTTGSSCGLPNNITASNIQANKATINWTAVSGANSYIVKCKLSDGTTWATHTTSTNSLLTNNLVTCKSYDIQVKANCGGSQSGFSTTYTFTTTGCSSNTGNEYCEGKGKNASYEWIAGVKIGTINNTSNKGDDNGYGNYTAKSTDLTKDTPTPITLTPGYAASPYKEYWKVWIDLNQNGKFTDDGELVFDAGNTNTTVVNATITIPASAKVGATRMRVAMKYNGAAEPCEQFGYGEVEDYTVNIKVGSSNNNNDDAPANYCEAKSTNSKYEWIDKVTVGSINNTSGNNDGYGNFLNKSTEMTTGQTYSISLKPGYAGSAYKEYWKVWIDWNRDGDFNDAGEVAYDAGALKTTTVNGAITVPNNAKAGETRMRVTMKYNGAANNCGSYAYGEVEDYTINISASNDDNGGPSVTYCPAKSKNSKYEWIESIALGDLVNQSGNNDGYGDFTENAPTSYTKGDTYNFVLTPGYAGSAYKEYWRVWVDWNQDGDFNDVGETVYDAGGLNTTSVSGAINIPFSAKDGDTRMRVAMKYNGAATSCEEFGYGEVEDYTINISSTGALEVDCDIAVAFDYNIVNLDVRFLNQSTGDYDTFFWSFGDGATSDMEHPIHVYDSVGDYYFTLEVSNSVTGCTNIFGGYVHILEQGDGDNETEEDPNHD